MIINLYAWESGWESHWQGTSNNNTGGGGSESGGSTKLLRVRRGCTKNFAPQEGGL